MSAKSAKTCPQNANLRLHPENLKPHPENLKRGGKKPRPLTKQEIDFCVNFAASGKAIEAAILAKFSRPRNCYSLLARPLVRETVLELRREFQQSAKEAAMRSFEISVPLVDETGVQILVNGKNDVARVKALETIYRRLKLILPGNVNVQNNTDNRHIDIYKPLWLREREAQMLKELEQRLLPQFTGADAAGKPLTLEEARGYLERTNGDKDAARALATAEGRTF